MLFELEVFLPTPTSCSSTCLAALKDRSTFESLPAQPGAWPSQYRFDLLPNVIMSAHDSGVTPESQQEALRQVSANLDHLARHEPLENVVRNRTNA